MWNLKYYINELICETDTQTTEDRLLVAIMVGGVGRMDGELGLAGANYYIEHIVNNVHEYLKNQIKHE